MIFWTQMKSDDCCTSTLTNRRQGCRGLDACPECLTHASGHRDDSQGNVKRTHHSEPIALASGDQCEKARPAVHQGMQVAEGGAQLLGFKSSAFLSSSAQAGPHFLFLSCLWPGTHCRRTDAALCCHLDANPSESGPKSMFLRDLHSFIELCL